MASSASPRESWNEECRWQSMKPGVATVRRPSSLRLPENCPAISGDLPTATILPSFTAIAASRMMRRSASTVISQSMSVISRSIACTTGSAYLLFPACVTPPPAASSTAATIPA